MRIHLVLRYLALAAVFKTTFFAPAWANTIVRVSTTLGDFSLELFDDVAPLTVSNFLNYVNSDRYDGTVIHRSEPNFVIQGGWLRFDETQNTFFTINRDPNITNEFGISNTRGTIAMAKQAGNPDSANSQWFINLNDNTFLDTDNGGFTVFGRVMGDGMEVVDQIQALPRVLLAANSPFPTINFNGVTLTNENLVNVTMSVVGVTSEHSNTYDPSSGVMRINVDLGEGGLLSFSLTKVEAGPGVIMQVDQASIEILAEATDKMATFDPSTSHLILPELAIGGDILFRNLTFLLSDIDKLQFTLDSFEVAGANFFDQSTGLIQTIIDIGDGSLVQAEFEIFSLQPQVIIRLRPESLLLVNEQVPDSAIFNTLSGRLLIPNLLINFAESLSNLTFVLSDPELLLFSLEP